MGTRATARRRTEAPPTRHPIGPARHSPRVPPRPAHVLPGPATPAPPVRALALLIPLLVPIAPAWAQSVGPCEEPDAATHCEVREWTLGDAGAFRADGLHNAHVVVEGWDSPHVRVVAELAATGPGARQRVEAVRVSVEGGVLRVDDPGRPEVEGGPTVWVHAFVPRATPLDLATHNGTVGAGGTTGRVRVATQNGRVLLHRLTGAVEARTQNGEVRVDLPAAHGALDVATQNGRVQIEAPAGWDGRVVASADNGTVTSTLGTPVRPERGGPVTLDAGSGTPLVRASTHNGHVSFARD